MASSQRDHTSAGQMDDLTRPYFIHHRNQVGINSALMDLFRLIDLFLQTDESARNHLMALRSLSDFIQDKQLIAPMSGASFDLYDNDDAASVQRNSSQVVGDLLRFVSSLHVPNTLPHQMGAQPRSIPETLPPRAEPFPSVAHSRVAPTPFNAHPNAANDLLFKPDDHVHEKTPLDRELDEPKDVSCVQTARDKLRSWLARPDTAALKRIVGKRRRTVSTLQESKPTMLYSPVAHTIGPDTPSQSQFAHTRPTSMDNGDGLPRPYAGDKVIVVTETSIRRDSIPAKQRHRSVSFSHGIPLPTPPPTQVKDGGFNKEAPNPSEPTKTLAIPPSDSLFGSMRLRKQRPTSITFATPIDKPNERASSASGVYPRVLSPMSSSSARPTTVSSDTSLFDAPILQASKRPVQHAQATNTRLSADQDTQGSTPERRASSNSEKQKVDLPPLPDDSTDAAATEDAKDVPEINVQPPSSAGTSQRNQTPRPDAKSSEAQFRPNPTRQATAISAISSSSKRPILEVTTSRPRQVPSSSQSTPLTVDTSSRQERPSYSQVPSTVRGDVHRSSSARSYPPAPRRHEKLVRSQSTRERGEEPSSSSVTPSVASPSAKPTAKPASNGSGHTRLRKPVPQMTPEPPVTVSMVVLKEDGYVPVMMPAGYERRPLSIIKSPVNLNPNLPYPSPKSGHILNVSPKKPGGAISDHETSQRPRNSPRVMPVSRRRPTSKAYADAADSDGSARRRNTEKSPEKVIRSRFSMDTETSYPSMDEGPRRSIYVPHQNSLRMTHIGNSPASRPGNLLAGVAAQRKSAADSNNSGSSSGKGHPRTEAEPMGPKTEVRVNQDQNHQQPRKIGQFVFPDSESPARSHSDNRGPNYSWRGRIQRGEVSTTEWFIDDSAMEREKRPSL